MELLELIQQLQEQLNAAYVAADKNDKDGAKEYLRAAKDLLDSEFLHD
jgi:prephenate dehydrogenase